jgi:hypothetical protein
MSADPSEGWHTNDLPTAQLVPQLPIPPTFAADNVLGVMAMSRGAGGRSRKDLPVVRINAMTAEGRSRLRKRPRRKRRQA